MEFLDLLTAAKSDVDKEEIVNISADLAGRWLNSPLQRDVFLNNSATPDDLVQVLRGMAPAARFSLLAVSSDI